LPSGPWTGQRKRTACRLHLADRRLRARPSPLGH